MKRRSFISMLSVSILTPLVFGQKQSETAPVLTTSSLTQVLNERLTGAERIMFSLADAMPEEKYPFTPTNGEFKGMRSFAGHLKHVAFSNTVMFSAILGEPIPTDDGSEDGPAAIKTRAELLEYLRSSFTLAHRAVGTINEQNATLAIKNPSAKGGSTTRMGLTIDGVAHCFMHYGELLIYMRAAGVLPPD